MSENNSTSSFTSYTKVLAEIQSLVTLLLN
jgi:hypothetical protein